MNITCLGAARTVTGSSYLVELDDKRCFLVDCGMYQGGKMIEARNWLDQPYRVNDIEAILITHAHIDHSGLVPRLVRLGYRGPVYASRPTCDLLKILWLDSAHIQEMEASWQSRKNNRQGRREIEPLYITEDAENAAALLQPVELDQELEPLAGVTARFIPAGHILGAASLYLNLPNSHGSHHVGFSGDLGRPGQLIVPDAEHMPRPQAVFMETTYGARRHKSLVESQKELVDVIEEAYAQGGKVLIPAFAVERTQEIIYTLSQAYRDGKLPKDMPVFLDSPLAIRATEIFRNHPEFFDEEAQAILAQGYKPFDFPNLTFTLTTDESRAINNHRGPAVIMAGNGMASAGRIKHHLKHNLWRPETHVVIVGFQAKGTTGRLLVEGARRVKIFREDVAVAAKVHTIGGFSAHADQEELLGWLSNLVHPGLMVYLIHGEEASSREFRRVASQRFPEVDFHIPAWKEVLEIGKPAAGRSAARRAGTPPPPPEGSPLDGLVRRLASLQGRLRRQGSDADPAVLAAMEEALASAEAALGAEASAGGEGA
ncbi:MAG: MBL fold metallo-hydrolase [Deltaproteobacteria bacterium]|nr:MBL fold metallo-hydrolase [Deltaproteobacteria bacterium]